MRKGRGAATNPSRACSEGPRAGLRRDGERESSQSPGSRRPICPSYFHHVGVGNALRRSAGVPRIEARGGALKIRLRVAERKATLVREEAARKKVEVIVAKEHVAREEEIQAALSRRNPPAAPPCSAPRRDAASPQLQPPAPTPAPRSGSRAPTASATASSTALVHPLHPASPVSDQQQEYVGDGESQQFQGDDNFLPDLSQRPPPFWRRPIKPTPDIGIGGS
jgi:hypothetical protein